MQRDSKFGHQNYHYHDQGSSDSTTYEQITDFPTATILTNHTTGDGSVLQHRNGPYVRVIIVRYTGEVREVVPKEYFKFKSHLCTGVYQPVKFNWTQVDVPGESYTSTSGPDYNQQQIITVLKSIDPTLRATVRAWFGPVPGVTRQLPADVRNYISPLLQE
jgi:hypothetical protein